MDDKTHLEPGPVDGYVTHDDILNPAPLLLQYWKLFSKSGLREPVIDLACGKGHNGIFLATQNMPVVLIDRSVSKLDLARRTARQARVDVDIKRMDLEQGGMDPLPAHSAGGMLVFRYLHRPLIPAIKSALKDGGILIYETFTRDQTQYGRPQNPDHLLMPGELKTWFGHWQVIHYFEGLKMMPTRAIAQIVCRKGAVTQ